jgi:hypothetical protein
MGASAIELRGKFGVMDDDRDRDPRTSGKASEVDSRSLSLNLSFPSLNNKAHMHMHWPESDATCIYTVDAWCSGAIRLNQSATASACAVLLCSDHHRIDSFCSRGRGLGAWTKPAGGWGGSSPPIAAKLVELLVLFFQF